MPRETVENAVEPMVKMAPCGFEKAFPACKQSVCIKKDTEETDTIFSKEFVGVAMKF